MRSMAACLMAGVLAVLAMDLIAPPARIGLMGVSASAQDVAIQSVNRTLKGDRLRMSATVAKRQAPPAKPRSPVIVGCEPLFSPLVVSAHSNFAGRCIA